MTASSDPFQKRLQSAVSNTGKTMAQLCAAGKTLVVFLRHGGCTFCREALEDLRRSRSDIERSQTRSSWCT
jgi:hypothetical protein